LQIATRLLMSNITSESIEISNIKLNLNGIVVELKVEEARKLWSKLDELFGPKPAQWIYWPQPVYSTEKLWVDTPDLPAPGVEITCNVYAGNTLELK
jgi:hypothetical protein